MFVTCANMLLCSFETLSFISMCVTVDIRMILQFIPAFNALILLVGHQEEHRN